MITKENDTMLTTSEKAILMSVNEVYTKVGKNKEGLYFVKYNSKNPKESWSYYVNVFKPSLFAFIQEQDEYFIKDLLKEGKNE